MVTTKRPRTTKTAKKTQSEAAPEVAKVTTNAVDIQQAVRVRAYELFEQRGCQHGHDFDDWLRAENEILMRFGARTA
jgi:hypothetical protein